MNTVSTMELREPKRKRRVRITLQQPFPILNRDVTTNKDLWQVYTGRYSGDFVIIDSKDEMTALYNMGFFGKGSLSRWNPEFGKMKQGIPPFVRQHQFELRKKWAAQQDELISQFKAAASKLSSESLHKGSESERNEERNGTSEKNNELNIDVNSNKDDEIIVDVTNETNEEINVVTNSEAEEDMNVDVTSIDESSSKRSETKVDEVITVDLAEEDNVSKICNKSVGKNNNNESKNNGEIVVLYKQGPPFYHASYIVIIDVVDSDTWKRLPTPQQTLTWTRLLGLNRESVEDRLK
ncbi:hypothetical protein C0J52_07559 [Blattella germanica]|nr:hypothetical protein C0J52_07559 [Blattella germanica]